MIDSIEYAAAINAKEGLELWVKEFLVEQMDEEELAEERMEKNH